MNTARTTGVLATGSRGLVDWLTGAGFLMLHATGFFVALVVLIPWNLYTDPGDFWAADPLIRWAFLLAFHALLVGVWSLIRNVILADDDETGSMEPSSRTWQTARATSTPVNFRTSYRPDDAAATTASALLAEEWARQWLVDPGEDTPPAQHSRTNGRVWDDEPSAAAVEWPKPPAASPTSPEEADEAQPARQVDVPRAAPRTAGPLGAAARATNEHTETDDAVDPDLEWRWIEAAASAWLTRKERDTYTGGRVPPPAQPGDDSASP